MNLFEFETTPDALTAEGGGKPAEAPEKPEWLEERFSSVEDQAKSYAEARREMNRMRSEMEQQGRQFAEALQEVTAEQQRQTQRQYDPNADPDVQAWRNSVESGDPDGQLAAMLKIQQRLAASEREQQQAALVPQMEQLNQQARIAAINEAERIVKQEAIDAGLDYEASRPDIEANLRSLYGDALLPPSADPMVHVAAMQNAVRIAHAQAVLDAAKSGELLRREKLAAGTVQPGATGRTATGSPQEKSEWDSIKGADDSSYSGMMSRAQRQ